MKPPSNLTTLTRHPTSITAYDYSGALLGLTSEIEPMSITEFATELPASIQVAFGPTGFGPSLSYQEYGYITDTGVDCEMLADDGHSICRMAFDCSEGWAQASHRR